MMAPMIDVQESTVAELQRALENERKAHQRTKDALTASQAQTTAVQKEFEDFEVLNARNVFQITNNYLGLERKAAGLERSLSEAQSEAKKAREAMKAQTALYNRHLERLNAQILSLRREAKACEPKACEPKACEPKATQTDPEPEGSEPEPSRPPLSPVSESFAELQEENQRLFASLLQ